jgi:hypothetical protein
MAGLSTTEEEFSRRSDRLGNFRLLGPDSEFDSMLRMIEDAAMPLPQSVIDKVKRDFPGEDHEEVLEILSFYGTESYEREIERVLLAVLNLSEGNKEAVWELVDRAKKDYRDVLFWSEYPEESRLDTPEKIAKFETLLKQLGVDFKIDWNKPTK